jgi:hypothetical protein
MKDADFQIVLNRRLEQTKHVLGEKAKAYMRNDDRLHNFFRAAEMLKCTPQQALLGFVIKHFVRLVDIIQSGEIPSQEVCDEVIGDPINYLHLLDALFAHQRAKGET